MGKQHILSQKTDFLCIAEVVLQIMIFWDVLAVLVLQEEKTSGTGILGEQQVANSSFAHLEFLELGTTVS